MPRRVPHLPSLIPPERRTLWIAFGVWAAISAITASALLGLTLAGETDAPLGGDFVAFHGAARAAAAGLGADIYDPAAFADYLRAHYPGQPNYAFAWRYPPAYFLIAAPFAALPAPAAFALWSLAAVAMYIAALRLIVADRLALFAMLTGPAAYAALISGQNGFLTAALIALAAMFARSRPLLAGAAAGLLIVKPHLALLIPVAFLAGGCWRASIMAVATAAALAVASLVAYGAAPWAAFFAGLSDAAASLHAGAMPLYKMTSPMAAALHAGAPRSVAIAVQGAFTLGAAAFVWRVWRREGDAGLRACALIAATLLAAPYGFYYDLILLAAPTALIALRGAATGWLKYERQLIAAAYVLPALPTLAPAPQYGVSFGFLAVVIVAALVWRRLSAERQKGRRDFIAAASVPSSR